MQSGLGIKKLSMQNVSLLKKWLWRFCSEYFVFVEEIHITKLWSPKQLDHWRGKSFLWMLCREDNLRLWPSFIPSVSFNIGNGVKTSFWNENWLGLENLKNMFPDLYILSLQQMDTVAQVWSPQSWDLIFRRVLNDWGIDRVAGLL